ncbi:MAG: glycoside hydrolase family 38 N-terminal domain-containing protein [Pirellulales bacterium]
MLRNAFLVLLAIASTASGAERVVWQIGKPDRDYREFAIAGNHAAYAGRFAAKPVVFQIGQHDAARDWPFIQPGPTDAWAGARVHPRTIRFNLADEPRGPFTLRVELVDTHGNVPPTFAITVGGRTGQFSLARGGGDGSLTDPRVGKPSKIELPLPASLFKKGINEIVLACVEGSWVQYDAVTLLNDPEGKQPEPDIRAVKVASTPFYIRRDGKACRAVEVSVELTAPVGDLALRVEAGGQTVEVPIQRLPQFGAITQEVGVPDLPGEFEVKATATFGSRSKTAVARVAPQRKWRVFVAPSSHNDIGYTDIQPKCVERHNENADAAIDLLRAYPDFRWNLEVAWQAENYLAARKGARLDDFLRLAREGKLGIQALYCNVLTGLCSHEEACRLTAFAAELQRRYDIPYRSAMISDVPTMEASIPMILANSGIRYFSSGINNTRGVTFTQMYAKSPCWWEGPDGSRVLMMFVPGYAHASGWALDQTLDRARAVVLANLRGYEARQDYPYDAVFLHGAVSDNCALNSRLAEVVKAWNDRYEYPKLILSHNAEFFEYVEKQYGEKLPVYRGSGGTYWEDGAGSSARETALDRSAHESLANGEKLLALTQRQRPPATYPRQALRDAWRNCLLYDEHTWGAHCSITQPDTEFTKSQWKIKAQFAIDANKASSAIQDQGVRSLASLVRTDGRSLVVVNPTGWQRTEILRATLPAGLAVADSDVVSCDDAGQTLLAVKDVPACGYRVLKLEPRAERPVAKPAEGTTIESRYYRVEFDPATGAVTSIRDKESNRELVDPKAPYRLNQYLYVTGGKDTRIVEGGPEAKVAIATPEKATLRRISLGNLGEKMIVQTSAAMTPKITSEITVWNDVRRVDIANRLTKTQTYDKEAVYFAFPFAAEKPTFRYEVPDGIVSPNTDMLPGACLDWFTVQHFVEIESRDSTIAWATPDAPLVTFQDINRGKWQTQLPLNNGHVYAYVMNNYWFTNYLAGQGGDFLFRFAVTSQPKADRAASARFGWDVANPLIAVAAEANPAGTLAAAAGSLVSVAEPNVMLVGVKRAEADDALVLRLWEMSGKATTAHVRLELPPGAKATACNLVETPQGPLEIRDGTIAVPVRGSGLATVRVE